MRPLRDLGFLVLVSASVAVGGCGSGAGVPGSGPVRSGAGSKSAGRIGAVLPTFSHPFFLAQKRGLEEKAKELGVEIDVRDGQDDDVKQISQVETLINLGCNALILCPRDEDALVPAVEAANRAGVPIIALNRRINGGTVLCYVGADDAEGGVLQGEALVESLGPRGARSSISKEPRAPAPSASGAKDCKPCFRSTPRSPSPTVALPASRKTRQKAS